MTPNRMQKRMPKATNRAIAGFFMSKNHEIMKRLTLRQGEVLIRQGEYGTNGYVIQNGQMEVFLMQGQEEVTLAILGPGEVVGEQAILHDSQRSASVRALTDCTLVVMDRDAIAKNLSQADPSIRAMIKILSERLKHTSKSVAKTKNASANNKKADIIFQGDKTPDDHK